MGTLSTFFNFKGSIDENPGAVELPEIFPLNFTQNNFIAIDTITIYSKILTGVLERTIGLTDEHQELLWDNCLTSSSNDGLITMLSKALVERKDLFLIYDKALKLVRQANSVEQAQIKREYETNANSKLGVYISFKNFQKADLMKFYSGLEFSTIASLYKSMNLAKAIQLKMHDLRASVALSDSADAKAQAQAIAKALNGGKDILLDAKDFIETAKIDLASTKESINFIDAKRSFYLGMPISYITGVQTGGIGSSGENDTKAVERGLRAYYFSIVKPVLEKLFEIKLSYKTQDFRQIDQALSAMQTFDLVSEEYVSKENKKKIIESLLDLDPKTNKTNEAEPEPVKIPSIGK